MTQLVKLCPECGEEYVATAERCIDCGVALVFEGDSPPAAPARELAVEGVAEAIDPAELVPVRDAEIAWARRLAEGLEAAGIPCRVAPIAAPSGGPQGGWSGRWGVFVRRTDQQRAKEVDAALLREEIPELGGEVREGESAGCPACGHDLAPDAAECPDCGLVLPTASEEP